MGSDFEPIDEALLANVNAMQARKDSSLLNLCELKRQAIEQIAKEQGSKDAFCLLPEIPQVKPCNVDCGS